MSRNPLTDPQHNDIVVTSSRRERRVSGRIENTVFFLDITRHASRPYKQNKYCSVPQWRAWCRDTKAKVLQRGESPIIAVEEVGA